MRFLSKNEIEKNMQREVRPVFNWPVEETYAARLRELLMLEVSDIADKEISNELAEARIKKLKDALILYGWGKILNETGLDVTVKLIFVDLKREY